MKKIFLLLTLFLQTLTGTSYAQTGNALDFDGINDYVDVPDPESFYLTNSYTIECWIKPKAFSSLAGLVSKKNTDASQGFTLRLTETAPYTGINFDGMTTANGILSADTWYHIAAVNDNGTRYLYINGVRQNLSGTPTNYNNNNTDKITIGADNISGTPKYFKGILETIRINFNPANELTIKAHMNNPENFDNQTAVFFQFNQGTAGGNNSSETTLINRKFGGKNGTLMNFALNGETSNWVSLTGWTPATYYLYVNQNAGGTGTGLSWTNAFTSLATALDYAYQGAIVWVARGIYKPTNDTNRDANFSIGSNVRIYGGFAGNESSIEQRNWQLNETILSGNIGDINTDIDNSYHVVLFDGVAIGTTMSGFTIRDGNASNISEGGGIFIRAAVSALKSSPTIEYCKIIRNKTTAYGGGIYINSSNDNHFNLNINQCVIANNSAKGGGGIFMIQRPNNPAFDNLLNITNCTIANNISTSGQSFNCAVYIDSYNVSPQKRLTVNIKNSVIWGNDMGSYCSLSSIATFEVSYSDIQGLGTSGTNIDTNPYFTNPEIDDFSINSGCSPIINAGTNDVPFIYDLKHNPRIRTSSQIIDMGAYEYYGSASAGKFYVKPSASGNGKGFDWNNAMSTFPANTQECLVSEVWVATGTYKPTADNDRNKHFAPLSGAKYYGGFAGNEATLDQRNWATNKTILSGNIGNLNDSLDNSLYVIRLSNANSTLLDGFIIQEAYGGTGIRIENSFNGQANSVLIANCIIRKNYSPSNGGGIYNLTLYYPSDVTLVNTAIYGNSARQGGGIANFMLAGDATIKLINCTIAQNTATETGGAIYNYSASNSVFARDSIFNSIIWANIAPVSPGIGNNGVSTKSDAFYSNVQGFAPDVSRKLISTNPFFTNPEMRDYSPSNCGQSINSGNDAYLLNNYAVYLDILGNKRIKIKVDMGAYEFSAPTRYSDDSPQQYVNKNATGKNDGSSWADAFTELSYLQLAGCVHSKTIWVAGGTYRPTPDADRTVSFEFVDNLKFYGGFAGNETTLESRNWVANPTILNGNIGDANTDNDNSYHILKLGGKKVLLDGFIIEKGNANGSDLDINYQKQSGGGILLVASQDTTDLTITNCIIRNNEALYGGGGVAHFGNLNFAPSRLKIYGSLFTNNKSAQGASICHYAVSDNTAPRLLSTQLINCTISKNSSDMYGTGGIYYTAFGNNLQSEFKINNSILWDNPSLFNPQIEVIGSENGLVITNTTIQNNRFTGTNILNTDPQFDTGAFILKNTSPCRNIGDNTTTASAGLTKDLGFGERLTNLKVDLGAYEGNQICLSNQNLSQTFNNGTLTVQDGNVLTSTSKVIPTSNTTFDAKNAVVLQPGFTAGGNGVVFTAQIGGCN